MGLKGLRVLGPKSPGFPKLPSDSDAQQNCRKQREQGSTDYPVAWQEPPSLPSSYPHPSLCRTEILDPSPSCSVGVVRRGVCRARGKIGSRKSFGTHTYALCSCCLCIYLFLR